MLVTSLCMYPVKGCHRVEQRRAVVGPWGLVGDRRWLIGDDEGRMLTQREDARLTQVYPSIVDGSPVLRYAGRPDLTVVPGCASAASSSGHPSPRGGAW